MFQLSCEGMAVLRACGPVEICREGFHEESDEVTLAKKKISFKGVQMFEELKFVVHEMYQTGHSGFVCFVDRCLQRSGIAVSQLFRGLFAICLYPRRVPAAVADEIQTLSNEEDLSCKIFGHDARYHRLVQFVLFFPHASRRSSSRVFPLFMSILLDNKEFMIWIRKFSVVNPLS